MPKGAAVPIIRIMLTCLWLGRAGSRSSFSRAVGDQAVVDTNIIPHSAEALRDSPKGGAAA